VHQWEALAFQEPTHPHRSATLNSLGPVCSSSMPV
jgi:hypothetical protein